MATHCSIRAWRIPGTEEPGGLQSTGSQEWDTIPPPKCLLFPDEEKPIFCLWIWGYLSKPGPRWQEHRAFARGNNQSLRSHVCDVGPCLSHHLIFFPSCLMPWFSSLLGGLKSVRVHFTGLSDSFPLKRSLWAGGVRNLIPNSPPPPPQDAAKVCREFTAREQGEVRFSAVALCKAA